MSQGELDYLQTRATAQCLSDTEKTYKNFTDEALSNLNNGDFSRNKSQWKYQMKQGTTTTDLGSLYVWGRNGTFVYMRLTDTINGDRYNTYYKIDVDQNDDMVRTLQTLRCAKMDSGVSESGSTITYTVPGTVVPEENGTEYSITDTTYRINTSIPAYFGNLNRSKVKKLYKNDGTYESTTTIDWTFTAVTAETQSSTSYNSSLYPNRKYGGPTFTTGTPYNTYTFPYGENIPSVLNQDTTTVPIGDAGSVTFDPQHEL